MAMVTINPWLLSLGLGTGLLVLLLVVIDARKKIVEHYTKKNMRKKGYGGVVIVHPNKNISTHYKKFTPEGFEIDGVKYNFNEKKIVYDSDGFAWIYYLQGDAEPIDLISEDLPRVDGKQYALMINKAMSIGFMNAIKKEDIERIALFIAAGGAVVAAAFAFMNNGDIKTMLQSVTAIKSMVATIKAAVPAP